MTSATIARAATGRHRLAAAVSSAAARLSTRAHAAGDARARDLGWEIARTPGRAGLAGRSYRDPRFATRAVLSQPEGACAGRRPA